MASCHSSSFQEVMVISISLKYSLGNKQNNKTEPEPTWRLMVMNVEKLSNFQAKISTPVSLVLLHAANLCPDS